MRGNWLTGSVFVGLGVAIAVLDSLVGTPYSEAYSSGDNDSQSTIHWFMHIAFGEIGVGGTSIYFAALGFTYLVLGDLIRSVFSERIEQYVTNSINSINRTVSDGLTGISKTISNNMEIIDEAYVLHWIESRKDSGVDFEALGKKALLKHFGPQAGQEGGFFEYIMNNIVEPTLGTSRTYRTNFSANATISDNGDPNFVVWEESKQYEVNAPSNSATEILRPDHKVLCDINDIGYILTNTTIELKADDEILFDLKDHTHSLSEEPESESFKNIVENIIKKKQKFVSDDEVLTVFYNEGTLEIHVRCEYEFTKKSTLIRSHERSFLLRSDPGFKLGMKKPTKNMTFTIHLPDSMQLVDVALGPEVYCLEESDLEVVGWPTLNVGRHLHVSVNNWVLPGIAVALTWAPTSKQEAKGPT